MAISTAIIFGFIVGPFALGVFIYRRFKSSISEVDYRTFFILGVTFLPVGISLSASLEKPGFIGIAAMGAIYLAISLINRNKWTSS